eukprot:1538469-Rhodomonas_salina.1
MQVAEVLEAVCGKCDFAFAEALCPRADGHCLVQTPAAYCRSPVPPRPLACVHLWCARTLRYWHVVAES